MSSNIKQSINFQVTIINVNIIYTYINITLIFLLFDNKYIIFILKHDKFELDKTVMYPVAC